MNTTGTVAVSRVGTYYTIDQGEHVPYWYKYHSCDNSVKPQTTKYRRVRTKYPEYQLMISGTNVQEVICSLVLLTIDRMHIKQDEDSQHHQEVCDRETCSNSRIVDAAFHWHSIVANLFNSACVLPSRMWTVGLLSIRFFVQDVQVFVFTSKTRSFAKYWIHTIPSLFCDLDSR